MEDNEQIAEKIMEEIDNSVRDLSDKDFCDVLDDISDRCRTQSECKKEELEKENDN